MSTVYQVLYTNRAKLVAAAVAEGWTEESGESLLDAVGDPGLRARLEPSEECCCVPISTG